MSPRPQPACRTKRRRRVRGAAILTAMLTVTLVASLAAAALWQQWRSLEVEAAQRARVQSAWILIGALDWARLILREDARTGGPDHLAEPWAVPLEEARLSAFFAADSKAGDPADDVQQSFISGQIIDLQSRLNVTNLIEGGRPSPPDVRQFSKLFELLSLPDAELQRLTENLRFAMDTSADNRSGAMAPLMPQRLAQLVWLGVSESSVAALTPFVTILPQRSKTNLNTASAEVIFAALDALDMARARQFVTARSLTQLRTLSDAAKLLGMRVEDIADAQFGVKTDFFEVRGRLRLDQVVVQERSMVQRTGIEVKTLWRERFASSGGGKASLQSP